MLADLDADSYAAREAAEQRLVEALIARPGLQLAVERAVELDERPEVRARCRTALGQLEEFRLVGQTRVTLHRGDAGDRELVEAFAEAAGVKFSYWPANLFDPQPGHDPPVPDPGTPADAEPLDLDGEGFFPALAALCRATGLGAMRRSPVGNDGRGGGDIYLARADGRNGGGGAFFDPDLPTCTDGAFAVQLVSLYRTRTDTARLAVGPGGGIVAQHNPGDQLSVSMRVLLEPKIHLSAGLDAPRLDEAVDDRGNSLLGDRRSGYSSYYGDAGWSYDVQIPLDASKLAGASAIRSLRGQVAAEVAVSLVALDVPFDGLATTSAAALANAAANARANPANPADSAAGDGREHELGPYRVRLAVVRPPEPKADEAGDEGVVDAAKAARAARAARNRPLELSVSISGGPLGDGAADAADGGQAASRRRDAALSALQVLDADGNAWTPAGGGGNGWDGTTLRVTRRFRPPGNSNANANADAGDPPVPARVRWELPARVRVVPIEFEFRDVPLPKLD